VPISSRAVLLAIFFQSNSNPYFSSYASFHAMATIKSSPASFMRPARSNLATAAISDETLHQQLPPVKELSQAAGSRDFLVISPYIETPHLLDLSTVEPQAQLLAVALTRLKSVREDYATAPYEQIFNWSEVIATLRQLCAIKEQTWTEQIFYIVVFRSQIPPTTDYSHLGVLDKAAHAEAMKSGGFLKSVMASHCEKSCHDKLTLFRYWFGSPDHLGRNLATCVWRTQGDARLGGIGPAHRLAAGAARNMYTEWSIDRLGLLIKNGLESWEISRWVSDA